MNLKQALAILAPLAGAVTPGMAAEDLPSSDTVLRRLTYAQAASEDRWQIIDALYRFAAGQDMSDAQLFRSAWASDARLDFVQPAKRFGIDLPPFQGRDNIVTSIMGAVAPLKTTHTVTNPRVEIDGDHAKLIALVEAQHVLRSDETRNLLLKNIFRCDLVREDGVWKIRTMTITNSWYRGDPQVLFPKS